MNFLDSLEAFLSLNTFSSGHLPNKALMVHSDAGFLLRRISPNSKSKTSTAETLIGVHRLLSRYVGPSGTLFFPGFFDEYARHRKAFDKTLSPPSKEMGALPRFIFDNCSFVRESNPLTNLIAVGRDIGHFWSGGSSEVYGYSQNSFWSKFNELSTEILFLGVSPTYMTYLHFLEVSNRAPYLFNKFFDIPILDNEKIVSKYSICPVRFRDSSIRWNFAKFVNLAIKEGAIAVESDSKGLISLASSVKISELFHREFAKNPFFMLESKGVSFADFQLRLEKSLDGIALPNIHLA